MAHIDNVFPRYRTEQLDQLIQAVLDEKKARQEFKQLLSKHKAHLLRQGMPGGKGWFLVLKEGEAEEIIYLLRDNDYGIQDLSPSAREKAISILKEREKKEE